MSKVIKGAAIAAAVIFTGGAVGIGLGLTGATLGTFYAAVNALAFGALLSGVQAQLMGSKKPPRPSVTVEYADTVAPGRILLGEVFVSGMNCLPPVTTGTNNEMLHQVLALAMHEVSAIPSVYFGQEAVGTMTTIAGNANDGKVTSGTYANKAWVRRYLGTSTQAADYILDTALTAWTSSHQGKNVAYLALQYAYDETVWRNGRPPIKALVQGLKCYDPRKDSTNGGSGSHRYATPSTWEWTQNPALQLGTYIIDSVVGRGDSPSRVDWTMVAAAADECDEDVAIPISATQKRYTCNVVLECAQNDAEHLHNMQTIAGAMLGYCIWRGGKWRISAGTWTSPEFEILDSDLVGDVTIETAFNFEDRWNGVRGTFIDPEQFYEPNEFPPVQIPAYVTADGESLFKDIRLDACTNVYEAQRAAMILTRMSRNRFSVKMRCGQSAWKVLPGRTGIVTLGPAGWVNQTVRCEGWKPDPTGAIDVTLRTAASTDYDDPAEIDYLSPLAVTAPPKTYFTPDAPTGLTAFPTTKGPLLFWTKPALVPSGMHYEVYEHTASTPFSSAVKVWEGQSLDTVIPHADQTTRYYWVLSRMPSGAASAEHPSGAGVSGAGSKIDTDLLEDDAATEVATAYVAGPVSSTAGSSSPTSVVNISGSPQGEDFDLEVTAFFDAYSSNTANPGQVSLRCYRNGGTPAGSDGDFVNVWTGSTLPGRQSLHHIFHVSAGETWDAHVLVWSGAAGATTATSCRIITEVVKK